MWDGRQKLIGRFHRLSMKVIGCVEKIGHLKCSVSVNESILNPIKWSRSCVKCWKKVMNGVGIFCRMFFWEQICPPFQMVWYLNCYIEHPKYDLHKSRKYYGGYWERDQEERYERRGSVDLMLAHFRWNL